MPHSHPSGPLPQFRLTASTGTAHEVARHMMPQMELTPPYQGGSVWTLDQRIALVKSWVMGVPIPAIILNDRTTGDWVAATDTNAAEAPVWAVVDGKQRIETTSAWFHGHRAVPAGWFPADHVHTTIEHTGGPYVTYTGLSLAGQRLLANRSMLTVVEARLPSVHAEAELYLLVNGGGTAQTHQDMTRAGEVAKTTS